MAPSPSDDKIKIMRRLMSAWLTPKGRNLRLGQLLSNAIGDRDIYYVSDDALWKFVEDFIYEGTE